MSKSDIPLLRVSAIIVCMFVLTLLGSCSKDKTPTVSVAHNEAILEHIKQSDIPVPVGFKPTEKSILSDKEVFCYQGNLTVAQSLSFYKQSMECNGWEIQDFSPRDEGLLVCNKAHRQCALSIRQNLATRSTDVHIVVPKPAAQYAAHRPKQQIESNNQVDIINKKKILLS